MTFDDVFRLCAGNAELVREFDLLTGSNLSMVGSPLDLMIDNATGCTNADLEAFIGFVFTYIWLPLVTPSDSAHASV